MPGSVGERALPELLDTPARQHVFWTPPRESWAGRTSGNGLVRPDAVRCRESFDLQHEEHAPAGIDWLNQIEIFSVIQKKVVTPNDFASLGQLSATLLGFVDRYNQTARPFSWKFTASDLHGLMDRISRHEQEDDPQDEPLPEAA